MSTASVPPADTTPPAGASGPRAPVPRLGGAAELRAWDRWARWTAHPRLRWKARVAGERAAHPVRAAGAAFRAARTLGAGVAATHGVSRARQWWQLWRLATRYGLGEHSYYRFQLFRPERAAQAAQYLDGVQYERVLRRYLRDLPRTGRPRIFVDKRAFEQWCRAHDLPSVRTVHEFAPRPGGGADAGGAAPADAAQVAAALPRADLFSKPADLAGGRGAARWTYGGGGDGRWTGGDGRAVDALELAAALQAQADALGHPVLVQERLRNHPDVEALTAGGLCTARMVTVRPLGGEPRLLLAVQRMPADGKPVDNFDAGGLAAPVDVATGRLGVAMRKDSRALAAPVERHPATGVQIAGRRLPCWEAAVALAERAHRLADPLVPVAGWDMAITPAGPALVEANNVPGINLIQMPLDTPLGETALVGCLLDYLDAAYR